ncbi:hypothetical protein V6N12_017390 [Hibiscus sabdariffa]|uniref:Serine aminopeptidase S33 domain-containing protein n=1 Tax=Hibiscus sabdariffa TaxID=183260 RepID=A0ABR2CFE2_9ROSI
MICSATRAIVIPRETKFQNPKSYKPFHFHVKTYWKPKCSSKDFNRLISFSSKTMAVEPLPLTSGASGRINALFSLRALRSLLLLLDAVVLLLLFPFRGTRRASAISSGEKVGKEDKQESRRKLGSSSSAAVVRVPVAMLPRKSATVVVDQEAAARRSLAIQRVAQDGDDETAREFSLFTSARGDTLFTQSWTPVSVIVRGVVVLLHGLNEHSGRYSDFAKRLNANGFKVYGVDWIGHGGSDGLHAYVHSLDYAVTDTKMFLEKVLADNPGLPCFCFGHSTGGAIILKAVLDPKVKAMVSGIILTSPAVGVQPSHPIFVVLAPVVSFLLPRYQRNMNRLRVPLFVLHGMDDTVTDPRASQKLYEEAASTDKSIKLFEGLLHDLLFEPEREAIMGDIIQWLNCRV